MSSDLTSYGLTTLGFFFLVFAGGALGLHLKNRIPGVGLRDSVRAMVYLTQYDGALEYHGLGSRERRAHVDELRANLAESATDGGVAAATARLGSPRVLATEVAGARMRPSWMRGAIWVGAAILIGLFALMMSASAFSTALPADTSATWSTWLWTLTGSYDDDGGSAFGLDIPFTTVLLLVVPFLVGARAWRLWTGRSAQRGTAASH